MRGAWSELRLWVDPGAMLILALVVLLVPLRWLLAWVLSVSVHELGHLLAVKLLGIPVYRVIFGASGARIETAPMDPGQELLCALAGPLAGLGLIFLGRWLPVTAICAFFHTLVNCLPFGNLDGGRVLRCILRKIPCKQKKDGLQ